MKCRAITFDEDGEPETLTFTMTINEANAILGVFGQFNGHAQMQLGLVDGESVYDGLSDAFCKLYDDGKLRSVPSLAVLLEQQ